MASRHDQYIHQILTNIETGQPVSQRSLSKELGVAVGLVNLLIRRLATKGYIKITTIPAKRVRYALTPSGMAEKARISRAYFENTVRLYTETRERIRARFEQLSVEWTFDLHDGIDGPEKRVVFYGAGEVAEIAYVSLQSTDLRLIGVIDDFVEGPFFGKPVQRREALVGSTLNGAAFGCVVVASIRKAEIMRENLSGVGLSRDRTVLL